MRLELNGSALECTSPSAWTRSSGIVATKSPLENWPDDAAFSQQSAVVPPGIRFGSVDLGARALELETCSRAAGSSVPTPMSPSWAICIFSVRATMFPGPGLSPVLNEIVTPGHEGVTFRDPGELSAILLALATADPSAVPKFAASRTWLAANPAERWEDQWQSRASAFVKSL